MTLPQLRQYDLFLDENDWDIYYWTTQNPPSAPEDVSPTPTAASESQASGQAAPQSESQMQGTGSTFGEGPVGEWAQTVGRVKEPYRSPPSRWRDSEILGMLRTHVKARAGDTGGGEQLGRGLGRMPDVRKF